MERSRLVVGQRVAWALLAGVVLLLLMGATTASAAQASTPQWPIAEGTCVAGEPWVADGWKSCPAMAPYAADLGRPVAVLTGAGEHYYYVVEQSYWVNSSGGGEYPQGTDAIVELRNEGSGVAPKFVACVSEAATPNCVRLPPEAIFQAQSAMLTPSGKNLYVASFAGIARLQIESSGAMHYDECIGLAGGKCVDDTSTSSSETVQLAMASNRDLYAVGEGTLTDFHIGSEGALTLGECYELRSACSTTLVRQEGSGTAVATPNGAAVIAAFEGEQVDVYRRNADGSLVFASCLSASGYQCPSVPGPAQRSLFEPQSVAIAPNGRDVYVTGREKNGADSEPGIVHLRLTESDTLEFVGCVSDKEGCEALPAKAEPFSMAEEKADQRLAVTPNGSKLLLGNYGVSVFALSSSTGVPSWEGCAGGAPFCAPGEDESISPQGGSLQLTPGGTSAWISDPGGGLAGRVELDAPYVTQGKPAPQASSTEISYVSFESARATASAQTHGLPTTLFFELEAPGGQITYQAASHGPEHEEVEEVQDELRLLPSTSYRVRLVAINAAGTSDGPWASIKSPSCTGYREDPVNDGWPELFATASSVSISGGFIPGCLPTTLELQIGTTTSYEKTIQVPASKFPVDDRLAPYFLEVSGLKPSTTYYLRLTATNSEGTTTLEEGVQKTGPVAPPAVQVAATTGGEHASGETAATVEGSLVAGDTSATVEAQLFDEPGHPYEPSRTISLPKEPASRKSVTVSGSITGLKCGHTYEWLLAAHTTYGESLGVRKPLLVPCSSK